MRRGNADSLVLRRDGESLESLHERWEAEKAVRGSHTEGGAEALQEQADRGIALRAAKKAALSDSEMEKLLRESPAWKSSTESQRKLLLLTASEQFRENLIDGLKPGPPCLHCRRRSFNSKAMNLFAKVTKLVAPAMEVNVLVQGFLSDMGVATVDELRRLVEVARSGGPEKATPDVYRDALSFCQEYRRAHGMADLIDPEAAEVAVDA